MIRIFLFISLLFTYSFTWDVQPTKQQQQAFDRVFKSLTQFSRCFPAQMMYYRYKFEMQTIYKKNLLPNKKQLKCHLDLLLSKYMVSKIWPHLASEKYKICMEENDWYKKLTQPPSDVTEVDLSITGTLQRYPYLREYMNPEKLTELLIILPQNIRAAYRIYRYTIIDHKLYNQSYFSENQTGYNKYLKIIVNQLPDMDFVIFVRNQLHPKIIYEINEGMTDDFVKYDGLVELHKNVMLHLPGFMDAKNLQSEVQFNKFLLIDLNKLDRYWVERTADIDNGVKQYPWDGKIQKAYYRSDVRGYNYGNVDVYSNIPDYFPRLNLMNISDHYKNIIDAQFSGNQSSWAVDFNRVNFKLKDQIFEDTQNRHLLKYRYLISMDGWTMSTIKLPLILRSNSLLVKPMTGKVVWFSNYLLPNVHYLPIHANLSNLVSQIEFLQQNDLVAKQIVRNANQFFNNNLLYYQTYEKMIDIMKQYAQHQNFVPQFVTKVLYQNYQKILMVDRVKIVKGLRYQLWMGLLMIAATYGAYEMAEWLLDRDINREIQRDKGKKDKVKKTSRFKDRVVFEEEEMEEI